MYNLKFNAFIHQGEAWGADWHNKGAQGLGGLNNIC
jgi:hypothetical protein